MFLLRMSSTPVIGKKSERQFGGRASRHACIYIHAVPLDKLISEISCRLNYLRIIYYIRVRRSVASDSAGEGVPLWHQALKGSSIMTLMRGEWGVQFSHPGARLYAAGSLNKCCEVIVRLYFSQNQPLCLWRKTPGQLRVCESHKCRESQWCSALEFLELS